MRHTTERRRSDLGSVRVGGDLTPAEHGEPFVDGDGFDVFACGGAGDGVLRQEADAGGEGVGAVGGGRRQLEADDIAQQFDGQLDQDACAVAAVGLGARGATVFEMLQGDQPVDDDGVRPAALDIGDHGDATGVRLVVRVVQALGLGECRIQH